MTEQQIIKILQTYPDIFKLDTILGRTIRDLFWGIVKVLGYIVDSISAITDKLFVLDKFYNNPKVIVFINSVKPLICVLFAISIIIIGYQLMFSQTKQFKKIGTNLFVAIAVLLVLPMAMDKMNALTNLGVSAVKGTPPNLTNEIIKSNITDVLVYDKANFDKNTISALKNPNNISEENIRFIDPTAIIEPTFINSAGIKNKEVFGKQLTTDVNGKLGVEKLNQGWLTFWKEYYYRFNINFLYIIISLGVMGTTLAFTCFKLARLIFELAYNKFLAILIAPIDINNGQKTKQILQNIMSTFIVTFLIAVLLKFYVLFVGMCALVKGIEGVILLVAGSFAVIDGPNIVEKLFGIDAGLRSGFKTMAGAYMVGKTAMNGAKGIGKTASNIAGGTGKALGTVVGASAGVASGLGNKKDDSLYKDMAKDKTKNKKSTDENKGKSLYKDMAKDKAKDKAKENKNPNNSNQKATNPSNNGGSNKPETTTKGNGNKGHQSLYDEMDGSSGNTNEPIQPISNNGEGEVYGQPSSNIDIPDNNQESINSGNDVKTSGNEGSNLGGHSTPNNTSKPIQEAPSNGGSNNNGQPSLNKNISDNTPEPINSGNGVKTNGNEGSNVGGHIPNNTPEPIQEAPSTGRSNNSGQPSSNIDISNNSPEPISTNNNPEPISNGGNERSEHTVPNNTQEPIRPNNDNSKYQTIGQHYKEKIVQKVQNNPIIKQTSESYNRGKNTGNAIRDRKKNNNK